MQRIHQSRKALSTVVTTLIILVVSVILAGVVTMYATNITTTRTQQEQLKLSKQAIWVMDNGTCYGALCVDNVGGKDVVVDKLTVRGVEVDWLQVNFLRLNAPLTTSLNVPNATINWDNFAFTGTRTGSFTAGSDDIPLTSGNSLVVYVRSPDSVNLSDVGVTIGFTVYTQNAQYYVECNVRAAISA
jgi:hypothetical protein